MLTKLKDPELLKDLAFIDGGWSAADDGRRFSVTNPATGEALAQVADLGATQTAAAIDTAARALPAWREQTAKQRGLLLRRGYDLILAHQEDLALIMTLEQGKPLAEARGEVAYGAAFIEWFAEEARRVYGEVIPSNGNDKRLLTLRQPVGVCAAITPWNFPIAMLTRKAGPALAAGCTLVVKPSEEPPLSALALAELAQRAGIPAGVLNVVVGGDAAAIGGELTGNPLVRKLSFTGSTRVGKHLLAQCAATVNVDIFYLQVSRRTRSLFNLFSYSLALFFVVVIIDMSLVKFHEAIEFNYRRQSEWAPHMHHFWIMMTVAGGLLAAQLSSDLITDLYHLISGRKLLDTPSEDSSHGH